MQWEQPQGEVQGLVEVTKEIPTQPIPAESLTKCKVYGSNDEAVNQLSTQKGT